MYAVVTDADLLLCQRDCHGNDRAGKIQAGQVFTTAHLTEALTDSRLTAAPNWLDIVCGPSHSHGSACS